MANQWFKFYGGEYLNDPKMKLFTPAERSCWLTLLCYASTSSVEGEVLHLTEKQLLLDAGIDPFDDEWNKTTGILGKFEKLDMIKTGSIGQIVIAHWNERQQSGNMSGYERIKRHRERTKAKAQSESMQAESFSAFWDAYPRKTAKQSAFKKWVQINPDAELQQKILAAIAQQAKSAQWQKDDGQFIPHAATWLNQERWTDEPNSRHKAASGKFDGIKSTKA